MLAKIDCMIGTISFRRAAAAAGARIMKMIKMIKAVFPLDIRCNSSSTEARAAEMQLGLAY
jgi:hypothetical protein